MGRKSKIGEHIRGFFRFTPSQSRGILWLLPLLAVVGALIAFATRPHFEESFLQQIDDDLAAKTHASPAVELFAFDPNTVTLQELCRLGFTPRTAAGIIRYRESGKRFAIPEDFATCHGVSLDDYTRLEPYIVIGDEFRLRRNTRGEAAGHGDSRIAGERNTVGRNTGERSAAATVEPFDPNELDAAGFTALGFSLRQAEVIVKYRASIGGFRSAEQFRQCYVVSDEKMRTLAPYIRIGGADAAGNAAASPTASGDSDGQSHESPRTLIDINTADSATLRSVSGIGEKLAGRIMDYRARLGGYVRVEQLLEIPGMYEDNFVRIAEQIFVDSCKIRKIDINFATPKELTEALERHPYISREGLRKLLKNRQLKGGWRTIGDMADENIVTQEQAARLGSYLIFRSE
ncbi:helix-hairpin-helix domain-containing protein [Alistipes sp. OttesenSCG-928-B03]|nr:helix-hairpin-helix domain-containing protein [Alistipes sp. OttesenSCG-928-B03]